MPLQWKRRQRGHGFYHRSGSLLENVCRICRSVASLRSGGGTNVTSQGDLVLQQASHAVRCHEQHHNIHGRTTQLKTETPAVERQHRWRSPWTRPVVCPADGHAATVAATESERSFLHTWNYADAFSVFKQTLRNSESGASINSWRTVADVSRRSCIFPWALSNVAPRHNQQAHQCRHAACLSSINIHCSPCRTLVRGCSRIQTAGALREQTITGGRRPRLQISATFTTGPGEH